MSKKTKTFGDRDLMPLVTEEIKSTKKFSVIVKFFRSGELTDSSAFHTDTEQEAIDVSKNTFDMISASTMALAKNGGCNSYGATISPYGSWEVHFESGKGKVSVTGEVVEHDSEAATDDQKI